MLDKRSGREVCSQEFARTASVFHLSGDPEKHTVDLRLGHDQITLTFTDEPIPPPEAKKKDESAAELPKPPSAARSILDALIKATAKAAKEKAAAPQKPADPKPRK